MRSAARFLAAALAVLATGCVQCGDPIPPVPALGTATATPVLSAKAEPTGIAPEDPDSGLPGALPVITPADAGTCPGVACADDGCCSPGDVCLAGRQCMHPGAAALGCTAGDVLCGLGCCPPGSQCADGGGGCLASPLFPTCPAEAPMLCSDALACCPSLADCATESVDAGCAPTNCSTPNGHRCREEIPNDAGEIAFPEVCCPDISQCVFNGGGCVLPFDPAVLLSADAGETEPETDSGVSPALLPVCADTLFGCADGTCCPTTTTCVADGCLGCPADAPGSCGELCCSSVEACTSGACATCPVDHPAGCGPSCCLSGGCSGLFCLCPPGTTTCDNGVEDEPTCCPAGATCGPGGTCVTCEPKERICLGDLDAGQPSFCCPAGAGCGSQGTCCPASHPVFCNGICCEAGFECSANGCVLQLPFFGPG